MHSYSQRKEKEKKEAKKRKSKEIYGGYLC